MAKKTVDIASTIKNLDQGAACALKAEMRFYFICELSLDANTYIPRHPSIM